MEFNVDMTKFNELLQIQKERQLAMQALSEKLGIDISFSNEETRKFAEEEFVKYLEKEVSEWMKYLLS
tara:strand:+ start:6754 stop:6957 length:204 start_codon:yes stop_codon:yes gene_type:complete